MNSPRRFVLGIDPLEDRIVLSGYTPWGYGPNWSPPLDLAPAVMRAPPEGMDTAPRGADAFGPMSGGAFRPEMPPPGGVDRAIESPGASRISADPSSGSTPLQTPASDVVNGSEPVGRTVPLNSLPSSVAGGSTETVFQPTSFRPDLIVPPVPFDPNLVAAILRDDPSGHGAAPPPVAAGLVSAVRFLSASDGHPAANTAASGVAAVVPIIPVTAVVLPVLSSVTSTPISAPSWWSAADSVTPPSALPLPHPSDPDPVGPATSLPPVTVGAPDGVPLDADLPEGLPLAGLLGIDVARLESGACEFLSSVAELGADLTDEMYLPPETSWLAAAGLLSGAAVYVAWTTRSSRRPGRGLVGTGVGLAAWREGYDRPGG